MFTTGSLSKTRRRVLGCIRIGNRQSMWGTGSAEREWRVNLNLIISNSRMGRWRLTRMEGKDTSIYDIII